MTETHERWLDQLSDHINGDLPPQAAEALEAHLASCGSCRDVLAELRQVVASARALEGLEPPSDLWPGIAAAIGAPLSPTGATVIELPTARQRTERAPGLFLSRRQLAAAASLLVMVSAATTWAVGWGLPGGVGGGAAALDTAPAEVRFTSEAPAPPAELADELESLESLMEQARTELDPATWRILEKNLAVIEAAIEDSYRALATDPDNDFLTDHLERAFQRKVDYLQNAVRVAGWSG